MTKNQEASTALNVHNGTFTVNSPAGHFTLKLYTAVKGDLAGKRILAMMIGSDNEADFRSVAFWDDKRQLVNVWKRFRQAPNSFPIDGKHWDEALWSATEKKLEIWCDLATRGDGMGEPMKDYPIEGQTEARRGFWAGNGYTLLLEGRCVVCNKKLTNPASILSGIGPTCAERANS